MKICRRCHGAGNLFKWPKESSRWLFKVCTDCNGAGTKPKPINWRKERLKQ